MALGWDKSEGQDKLPAKSGVSGALQVIVPGVMGISVWSPRLDPQGNSVRGVDFLRKMIARYNFHVYDAVVKGNTGKRDPRNQQAVSAIKDTLACCSRPARAIWIKSCA